MTRARRLSSLLALATLAGRILDAAPAAAEKGAPATRSAVATPAAPVPAGANEPEAGAKQRARSLYEQGAKAYDEGRYHAAADAFLDAHRVFPTPELCFNVAKAYDKLGHQSGALRYYREYLRRTASAPDAEETSARVRELERALAARGIQQLTVLSSPAGATVRIDGQPVGITPWTGETWPGRHRLALTLAGHSASEDLVEVDAHRAADVNITLAPLGSQGARSENPTRARVEPPRVSVLTWTALGTGTAALGGALALEMAEGENHGISRTGAFFTGVGLAATALGGVLLYLDLNPRSASSAPVHAGSLGVSVAGTHAALAGRF